MKRPYNQKELYKHMLGELHYQFMNYAYLLMENGGKSNDEIERERLLFKQDLNIAVNVFGMKEKAIMYWLLKKVREKYNL